MTTILTILCIALTFAVIVLARALWSEVETVSAWESAASVKCFHLGIVADLDDPEETIDRIVAASGGAS